VRVRLDLRLVFEFLRPVFAFAAAPVLNRLQKSSAGRYLRLVFAFGRFGLLNELAFRANFLVKISVELIWLSLLLIFYDTVFGLTNNIQGWGHAQFLIFLGCYYALEGCIETFFLENCNSFSELIRSGDLDLYLLKPIDEQFLITCRKIDWTTVPNIIVGVVVMAAGVAELPAGTFHWGFVPGFLGLFVCGVAMAYSFLVILMATAVWLVRNQSLMELWWLFTTLMRYPRDIYAGKLAAPLGMFFSFVVPILLVIYVPVSSLLHQFFEWHFLVVMLLASVVLLWLSRRFFRRALRSYRSASS
jgi:ABC-2 type transport system permease protein